jgi:hypothetical protein
LVPRFFLVCSIIWMCSIRGILFRNLDFITMAIQNYGKNARKTTNSILFSAKIIRLDRFFKMYSWNLAPRFFFVYALSPESIRLDVSCSEIWILSVILPWQYKFTTYTLEKLQRFDKNNWIRERFFQIYSYIWYQGMLTRKRFNLIENFRRVDVVASNL